MFTGSLSISRRDAKDYAAEAGCNTASGVTKATTIVVVGSASTRTLASGHQKSTKHRKAETLISEGQEIRIIDESDFKYLVGHDGPVQPLS